MSLKIYYSDKIEDLAAVLVALLQAERSSPGFDPFAFSRVIVPNTNVAKWLQIRHLAKEPNLCAGVEFPFAEKRLSELMAASLPPGMTYERPDDHSYARAIMRILLRDRAPELAPLRNYVWGDPAAAPTAEFERGQARMAWQLADKLAGLMDQYEVRRPEIVANWLAGRNAKGGPAITDETEAAEAHLARRLWGERGEFGPRSGRMSARQLFEVVRNSPPRGEPETIYLFGQSILSVLQVEILLWLAKTHNVVVLHNNVCLEYWGDSGGAPSAAAMEQANRLGAEDLECENELLRQWGAAGRETLRLLVDAESSREAQVEWICASSSTGEDAPAARTVLEKVQETVRRRAGSAPRTAQDASVQIVGAPGIRREVEMVYNAILGSVWKPEGSGERPWGECNFSDIAVLVPDMPTYRPVIEAVFEARGEIPYGLIDTTASQDSAFLAGFAALVDLGRRGLSREGLFAALDNPCVQNALQFSKEDARAWRELTARKLGAFDGFDAPDGDNSKFFTWNWALRRLRLGTVAGGAARLRLAGGEDEVPLAMATDRAELKFSGIVELLYRRLRDAFWREDGAAKILLPMGAAPDCWAARMAELVDEFLVPPADDLLENSVRRSVLHLLNSFGAVWADVVCDFELAAAAVEQFAGGMACRKGGYLTHGVTIAGLQPMRPVPFKQVFVLGMGEGGFPGKVQTGTLDIRGAEWRLGDVSRPKVNRFLMLELLMAVRERLVISYPNLNPEKDAELFPCAMAMELKDFIAKHIVEGGTFAEFPDYPLLEHGEREDLGQECVDDVSWRADDPFAGILPTYYAPARKVANLRRGANDIARAEVCAEVAAAPAAPPVLTARELAAFLRNPLAAVMKYRHGISGYFRADATAEPLAPLTLPSRARSAIRDFCVEYLLGAAQSAAEWESVQGAAAPAVRRKLHELELSGVAPRGYFTGGELEAIFEAYRIVVPPRARLKNFEEYFREFTGMTLTPLDEPQTETAVNLERGKCTISFARRGQYLSAFGVAGLMVPYGSFTASAAFPFGADQLESFLDYLGWACCAENAQTPRAFTALRVRLEDKIRICRFSPVAADEAKAYLAGLANEYLNLADPGTVRGGDFVRCDLKTLADAAAVEDGALVVNWEKAFAAMDSEDDESPADATAAHLRKPESIDELKAVAERRFGLLLRKFVPEEKKESARRKGGAAK